MGLPFAEVAVGREGRKYVAERATVPGLGDVSSTRLSDFYKGAAARIFEKNPDIASVRFCGPESDQEKRVKRAPKAF